jgi:hypothetical protein
MIRHWRTCSLVLACCALLVLPSCLVAPVIPPQGSIYSDLSAPLDTDLDQADMGSKKGEASSKSILGLISWGDASTSAAAKDGSITTVKHQDYRIFNVLGIFQRYTTVVHGD